MTKSKNRRNKKARPAPARSSAPDNQNNKATGNRLSKTMNWFLGLPLWAGVSGLLAVLGMILFFVDKAVKEHESVAHIAVNHTFRRDALGRWSVISSAENSGPAVADSLQMVYTATNSVCFSGKLLPNEDGSARFEADPETRKGADCGGVELIGAKPATQDQLAGVFIRDFSSVAELTSLGLTSGRIDSFKVGDTGWIEFQFRVADSLDAELQQLIPGGDAEELSDDVKGKFIDTFSIPVFKGYKVEVQDVDFDVIRLWTPDGQGLPDQVTTPSPAP